MSISEAELKDRLKAVEDPQIGADIISLNLVNGLAIEGDTAKISLAFNSPFAPGEMALGDEIRGVISEAGLETELHAEVTPEMGFDDEIFPNIRNVIAVASGKGGVGKTTVAANLAAGLDKLGARVGLLDADIHGPNVPRILPTDKAPNVAQNEERLIPAVSDGVKLMSMGFLVKNKDDPAIMRGPMVNNVMTHFLENVEWGDLDYLVVDLPPGTGDASLDLLQSLPVTGAAIVTTPQQMSLDDARKGLQLFKRHDAPILGIVENMSRFHCPTCDDTHDPFGDADGAEAICDDYGVELLGKLPIHGDYGADGTEAPVVKDHGSTVHDTTSDLIERIANRIGEINRRRVAGRLDEIDDVDDAEKEPSGTARLGGGPGGGPGSQPRGMGGPGGPGR
jgi:ATP-binding protein involved in chromosome partitioning